MEIEHIYSIDFKKEFFGEGPWVDEPDSIIFEHKGIECLVMRIVKKEPFTEKELYFGGHLCGYVTVPENSIFFDKDYNFINELDVYGGITFSECEEKKHLIGFDCAHLQDMVPSFEALRKSLSNESILKNYQKYLTPTYKTIDFVVQECKSLAEQIYNSCKTYQSTIKDSPQALKTSTDKI